MKNLHFIGMLLLLVLCSSCSVLLSTASPEQLMKVQKGMSQKEVMNILGKQPAFRSFDGNTEKWEYREFTMYGWRVACVYFLDDKVSEMDSFFEQENKINLNDNTDAKKSSSNSISQSANEKYKTGSIYITPTGKSVTVLTSSPGLIVTTEGEHILVP